MRGRMFNVDDDLKSDIQNFFDSKLKGSTPAIYIYVAYSFIIFPYSFPIQIVKFNEEFESGEKKMKKKSFRA